MADPPGGAISQVASRLPASQFLANYAALAQPHSQYRASNGRSQEEDFALAPQHAALSPRAQTGRVCRMPELRRAEAPASPLRILRILRRARGYQDGVGGQLR